MGLSLQETFRVCTAGIGVAVWVSLDGIVGTTMAALLRLLGATSRGVP